jgi:hypothetical protein
MHSQDFRRAFADESDVATIARGIQLMDFITIYVSAVRTWPIHTKKRTVISPGRSRFLLAIVFPFHVPRDT